MPAASTNLPAPLPELLQHLKRDPHSILRQGHADLILARSPGRLDILGGLSDFAGALACDLTLDAATAVALQRRDDRKLVIKNYTPPLASAAAHQEIVELSLDDFYGTAALLPENTLRDFFQGQSHWAASVAGAYPILARHKKITRRTPGANIAVYSTIPAGAGLASASATACAALAAMTAAYHLILDPLETALLAMKIEHHVVGSSVGISAAAASVLGKKDHIHLLHCQPHESKGHLPIPEGFTFLGLCAGAGGTSAVSASRRTRTEAFMAQTIIAKMYKDLGFKKDPTAGYLANVSPQLYPSYFHPILPEKITGQQFLDTYGGISDRTSTIDPATAYRPRAAAEYHIFENARAHDFVRHLTTLATTKDPAARESIAREIGKLLHASHLAAIQHGGPRSDATDLLFNLLTTRGPEKGFYGARATGGTLTLFARSSPVLVEELSAIIREFEKCTGTAPRILDAFSPGSAAPPVRMPLKEI